MKNTKKILSFALAAALICGGAKFFVPGNITGQADNPKEAVPTPQALYYCALTKSGVGSRVQIGDQIPIYSIIQDNGWGANYVKLRDIAFYMDFAVEWDASKPNEMRLYTNKHYLEPLNSTGPAIEVKTALKSTMDMYIDDVKVDMDAYIIDNNNFFKIRDLAKAVNFACIYRPGNNSYVSINANYPYVDGDPQYFGTNEEHSGKGGYPYRRTINYESPVWYDKSSGSISGTPVVQKAANPWARMNYFEKYASSELKQQYNGNEDEITNFNAKVQIVVDMEKIKDDTSGADIPGFYNNNHNDPSNFVKNLNPYYLYPLAIMAGRAYYPESLTSLNFHERNASGRDDIRFIIPPVSDRDTVLTTRQQAADILAHMNTLGSDREKITYLGQEVCKRITYFGYNGSENLPTTYDAVDNGSFWTSDAHTNGNCMQYTYAFQKICAAAGYIYINNKYHGPDSPGGHQWDIVFLPDEGQWVVVDCTYADGYDMYGQPSLQDYYEKHLCMDLESYDFPTIPHSGQALEVYDIMLAAYKAKLAGE